MKGSMKYVVAMVVALTVSSALVAAPSLNGSTCAGGPAVDTATWGGTGYHTSSSTAVAINSTSGCKSQAVARTAANINNFEVRGLTSAFGRLLRGIGTTIEGATWGGGSFVPPPTK